MHDICFEFEADFTGDLRCIPMAVRRKLDLAGIKLKLGHWSELTEGERQELLQWEDKPSAIESLRQWLLDRTAIMRIGQASSLPIPAQEDGQLSNRLPTKLLQSCTQLGFTIDSTITIERWGKLNELQRFALLKLSHPGHEHRNLLHALEEFGLVDQAS